MKNCNDIIEKMYRETHSENYTNFQARCVFIYDEKKQVYCLFFNIIDKTYLWMVYDTISEKVYQLDKRAMKGKDGNNFDFDIAQGSTVSCHNIKSDSTWIDSYLNIPIADSSYKTHLETLRNQETDEKMKGILSFFISDGIWSECKEKEKKKEEEKQKKDLYKIYYNTARHDCVPENNHAKVIGVATIIASLLGFLTATLLVAM